MTLIDKIREKYQAQDKQGNTPPVIVQVQELMPICVIADEYSADEEISTYKHSDAPNFFFDSKCELVKYCIEKYYDEIHKMSEEQYLAFEDDIIKKIKETRMAYEWIPIEFFLTHKAATKWIEAEQHYHGKLRTLMVSVDCRNYEILNLLKELNFYKEKEKNG